MNNLNLFTPNQLQVSLYRYLNIYSINNLVFPSFSSFNIFFKRNIKRNIINFPFRKSIINFFRTNIILLNSENLNGVNTRKYQKYLDISFNSKSDNNNLNEIAYSHKTNKISLNLLKNSIDLQNQLKKLFKKIN